MQDCRIRSSVENLVKFFLTDGKYHSLPELLYRIGGYEDATIDVLVDLAVNKKIKEYKVPYALLSKEQLKKLKKYKEYYDPLCESFVIYFKKNWGQE